MNHQFVNQFAGPIDSPSPTSLSNFTAQGRNRNPCSRCSHAQVRCDISYPNNEKLCGRCKKAGLQECPPHKSRTRARAQGREGSTSQSPPAAQFPTLPQQQPGAASARCMHDRVTPPIYSEPRELYTPPSYPSPQTTEIAGIANSSSPCLPAHNLSSQPNYFGYEEIMPGPTHPDAHYTLDMMGVDHMGFGHTQSNTYQPSFVPQHYEGFDQMPRPQEHYNYSQNFVPNRGAIPRGSHEANAYTHDSRDPVYTLPIPHHQSFEPAEQNFYSFYNQLHM